MTGRTHLTTVDAVHEDGSFLFTVQDWNGDLQEAIVVPCEDDPGVEAWINRCTHESQRFDTGRGVPMRDGQIICPRHGSLFDACDGHCENGDAAGTTLLSVEVAVELGAVYLDDDQFDHVHDGGLDEASADGDDDDDLPDSTSHIGF
jgi:nitrite reductase/ring-hydroxylating ferredoxin subunit